MGYSVTIVIFCVSKMIITCSPMIGNLFDTIIVASTKKRELHVTMIPSLFYEAQIGIEVLHLYAFTTSHFVFLHIKRWHVALVTNRVWSVVEVFIKPYA